MKLTHAVWEKRNMGVDCWEALIQDGDTIEEFLDNAPKFETEYTVIKIPASMIGFGLELQKYGYFYIETAISCHHDLKMPELNKIQKRLLDEMSYEEMTEIDRQELFGEIDKGIFTTDRIILDPYFTRKQANNRYKGWIKQETDNGSQIYKMIYRGSTVGFFTYKDIGKGVYFPYIGGIYESYLKAGVGFAQNCFHIEEAVKRSGKKVLGSYSTNNRGAASIHMSMGYILDETTYVYVKHI
ncbi:hypothetical protein [Anaerocolumna jejuensis]|uniref:hypothetical protein n=1 Tax=Anaerocolumna jejuensis TaxID=259063 RepID=UPI003F7C195B